MKPLPSLSESEGERETERKVPFCPIPNKKKDLYFFFMFSCLCVSEFMYTTEARQCLSPWSCELTHTGTRNWTWVFYKSNKCSEALSSLPSLTLSDTMPTHFPQGAASQSSVPSQCYYTGTCSLFRALVKAFLVTSRYAN